MKNEKNIYKTSQREILLGFFRAHPDEEFSTEDVTCALAGEAIGKSTVYRLISKLCEDGDILRSRGIDGKIFIQTDEFPVDRQILQIGLCPNTKIRRNQEIEVSSSTFRG